MRKAALKSLQRAAPAFSFIIVFALFLSAVSFAETETKTTSTSVQSSGTQASFAFSMVPSPVQNSSGYREGTGSASIQVQGTFMQVHMQAEGMASGAHFMLVLNSNGTSHSVANMTTSSEGEVEAEATVSLAPGTYSVGLDVLDTSTFGSPTQVLVSNPATRVMTLGQSYSVSSTTQQATQSVSTYQGGETEDDDIRNAIRTKVIPAVVEVGASGSSTYVTDMNFSVSAGRYDQNGYQISIFASNVTGPRVLLVNLTSSLARSLFSSPVLITLDGAQVEQSSSFSQVIGAQPGDPARFILVNGPSAVALLISIPHFSYHTVAIVPIIAQLGGVLAVDFPVLVVSALVVTTVFVLAYARRLRVEA